MYDGTTADEAIDPSRAVRDSRGKILYYDLGPRTEAEKQQWKQAMSQFQRSMIEAVVEDEAEMTRIPLSGDRRIFNSGHFNKG